jgi:hypothetical protein
MAMFDRVYDFFFGDQLRKHVVLISAFLLGQLSVIPLAERLEPTQYVVLAVMISLVFIWPLRFLYDRLVRLWRGIAEVFSLIKSFLVRFFVFFEVLVALLKISDWQRSPTHARRSSKERVSKK